MIDLSKSWEDAQVCAVLSRNDVRCYASTDEAAAALAGEAAKASSARGSDEPVSPMSTWHGCPDDWLCVYEHTNWGGRRLQFNDEQWHWLGDYGFVDQTSSWTNNQGGGLLGCSGSDWGALGNGAGDNRNLEDCAASSSLGSYDNQTEHVHG
ncbi:peptidase inhibitor family I36 protein [Plantactinospora sp. B6F1]|uniref:peptidase inhibitor family I36 protein n=1 Tax=Plantactinospora sp. B6F1 TaxID=3158971 RepID=UPI0032D9012B